MKAWAESLEGITYPLLSDFYPHGQAAQLYGVLRLEGYSERAIFVIDKRGVIRYVDVHDIDEQPDNEVLFNVLEELEPELSAAYQARQAAGENPAVRTIEPSSPSVRPEVVIYCTPWCPDCRRAKQFFEQHAIHYTEVDISRNREAARRLREWTGGKEITPTFTVGDEVVIDYDVDRLMEILGI